MEYYITITKNRLLLHAKTWIKLINIMLNKDSTEYVLMIPFL